MVAVQHVQVRACMRGPTHPTRYHARAPTHASSTFLSRMLVQFLERMRPAHSCARVVQQVRLVSTHTQVNGAVVTPLPGPLCALTYSSIRGRPIGCGMDAWRAEDECMLFWREQVPQKCSTQSMADCTLATHEWWLLLGEV